MKEPNARQASGRKRKQTYQRQLREGERLLQRTATPRSSSGALPKRVSDIGVMDASTLTAYVASSARSAVASGAALPKNKTQTFRHVLKGAIDDFLGQEGMRCSDTQDGLVDAIVSLAKYREEGVPLYPKIVVCDNLTSAVGMVNGSEPTPLGKGPRVGKTLAKALKTFATLARDQWIAYIERTPTEFGFGIFRQNPSPTAFAVRDTIHGFYLSKTAVVDRLIFVTQLAENVVELVGPSGPPLVVHLNAAPDEQASPSDDIQRLVTAVTSKVDARYRSACQAYLRTLFVDALRYGHGALIAVANLTIAETHKLVPDGVTLASPLRIGEAVQQHVDHPSEATAARLRDYRSVVEGMLSSDGITVFHRDARLSKFRVFVRLEPAAALPSEEAGGARRRAFRQLQDLVEKKKMAAAFIRSTDGNSEFFAGASNG